MNIASNLSGLSSASSSWATQAAPSSRRTAQTFSVEGGGSSESSSAGSSATQGARRGPPPGPPPDFNPQMSTAQFASSRGGDPIASLDGDQDGSVSAEEFGLGDASSDVQKLFTAIDADQNGALSSDEISSFRSTMQEAMKAERQAGGANGASAVSSTDASSAAQQLFSAIDTDQDGALSSDEIDSFRSKMQEAMTSELQAGGPPGKPPEASPSSDASSQKVATMLQRIAQDYLRVMGSDSAASTQTRGSSLSVSA